MPDIALIKSNVSALELTLPGSSELLGLTLDLLPPDDPKVKQVIKRNRDKMLINARKGKAATSDDEERISRELALAAVVGWTWTNKDASWNGDQPSFNMQALSEMVAVDWLRLQIDDHLGEMKNFFQR